MEQGHQFTISEFLSMQIHNNQIKGLTDWINSKGKSQYNQIKDVVSKSYKVSKDFDEKYAIDRITNDVSVYVLNQSIDYMSYLRKHC